MTVAVKGSLRTRFQQAVRDGSAYRLQRHVLMTFLGVLIGDLILDREWGCLILSILVAVVVISGIPAPVEPAAVEEATRLADRPRSRKQPLQ